MRKQLAARPRPEMTRGQIRQARREGLVPVSVSERGTETRHYLVPARELGEALQGGGGGTVVELKVEREAGGVLIPRIIDRNPISRALLQVGFVRVPGDKPVVTQVRVQLLGEPEDARTGTGVVEHLASTLDVRGLPDRIPTHIDVDTSNMEIGSVLHVSDIAANPDYEIVSPPETVLAVMHVVRAAVTPEGEEPVTEAEGEQPAAEPEGKES